MLCNTIQSGCNKCPNFVTSTSVTLSGSTLIIGIPENNYLNKSRVCICVAQNIPAGVTSDTQVVIGVGTSNYNLVNCGNFVYGDQIKSRTIYCTTVGTDTNSFVYSGRCRLPKTAHVFTPALGGTSATPTKTGV